MSKLLKEAYSTESFVSLNQKVGKTIEQSLHTALSQEREVAKFIAAEKLYEEWKEKTSFTLDQFLNDIVAQSVLIHHPKYIGHQVCMPLPIGTTIAELGSHLNNGMAVYEMGMAASVIDRLMIEELNPYFGYDHRSSGIFTSGGTIANITALLCARANFDSTIWKNGNNKKIGFMVSDQAHYCIDRAVRIMGLGDDGIILIPSDKEFKADISLLENTYQNATEKGVTIIGIVGSAPSTATGIFDDLEAMGNFAKRYNLWYHIDAAHGGPVVLSTRYKHLMNGSELADSITVDAHKMMMMPALTTMLLFRNHQDSYKTFAQEASYLFGHEEWDWSNYGKRTMECTKIMLGMRLYAAWKIYGMDIFRDNIDTCFDLAQKFFELLQNDGDFVLPVKPQSNIICFRLKHATDSQIEQIRENLLHEGKFYVLKTKLNGITYFRCTVMNPFTEMTDFKELIESIKYFYNKLTDHV
ncbi:MAG TPA: aminotransferase class I/II-fold pyridoxal phosphate-dependent enzyme [Saprospiraceae bacterium]|nr:aminotransferase class I/II-fold pyridoxal phosphate-dependent enzyme [Saprospiraceae bacterium]